MPTSAATVRFAEPEISAGWQTSVKQLWLPFRCNNEKYTRSWHSKRNATWNQNIERNKCQKQEPILTKSFEWIFNKGFACSIACIIFTNIVVPCIHNYVVAFWMFENGKFYACLRRQFKKRTKSTEIGLCKLFIIYECQVFVVPMRNSFYWLKWATFATSKINFLNTTAHIS